MINRYIIVVLLIISIISSCKKDEISHTGDCKCLYTDVVSAHPKALVLQTLIDRYTKKGLPGIALLIRDQNGIWAGASGYADIEKKVKMKACHISKIASITKLMVGTVVMKLVEEGKLNLDDQISKWLSKNEIEGVENADKVTIRQICNHTSGIYDVITNSAFYLEVLNNQGKFWTAEDLLKYAKGKPAKFNPGEGVAYSNTNLLLVSMVLEKITGRPHAELLREMIFNPLQMKDTYYHWHEKLPDFVAQGYYDLHNNGTIMNLSNYNTGSGNGYGGVYSTIYDMQTFIEALFKNKTILNQQSLNTMLTFTKEEEGNSRAFGITAFHDFLDRSPTEQAIGHRGRDLAYSADLFYFPDKDITMSFNVNYGTNGASALKQVFLDFRKELVDELMK